MKSKKLLSILCLLALTACGSNTSSTDNSSTQQESTSVAPSSEVLSNSSTTAESSSSDVSSEISSEVSSEVSSDTSSEVSSDTSSDISSEVSSETSSDTSSEVSSDTSSDISSEVSSETSSDTSSEVSSDSSSSSENSSSQDPTSTHVEFKRFVNFDSTYNVTINIAVGDKLEIGTVKEVTFTYDFLGYMETMFEVNLNGTVYSLTKKDNDTLYFEFTVGEEDLNMYFYRANYINDSGYTVSVGNNNIIGFNPTKKYTYGYAYVDVPTGYKIDSFYYIAENSTLKVPVEYDEYYKAYDVYGFSTNITLYCELSESKEYSITYEGTEYIDLEKSTLPTSGWSGSKVEYSIVTKDGYYVENIIFEETDPNKAIEETSATNSSFIMPDSNVNVKISVEQLEKITIMENDKVASINVYSDMKKNNAITSYNPTTTQYTYISATAVEGYSIKSIKVIGTTDDSFENTMTYNTYQEIWTDYVSFGRINYPAGGVTIVVEVEQAKKVELVNGDHYTIKFSNNTTTQYFTSNKQVEFEVTFEEGYEFDSFVITGTNKTITPSYNSYQNAYSFTMPELDDEEYISIAVVAKEIVYASITLNEIDSNIASIEITGEKSENSLNEVGTSNKFMDKETITVEIQTLSNKYSYYLNVTENGETVKVDCNYSYSCCFEFEFVLTSTIVSIDVVAVENEGFTPIFNVDNGITYEIFVNDVKVENLGTLYMMDYVYINITNEYNENIEYITTIEYKGVDGEANPTQTLYNPSFEVYQEIVSISITSATVEKSTITLVNNVTDEEAYFYYYIEGTGTYLYHEYASTECTVKNGTTIKITNYGGCTIVVTMGSETYTITEDSYQLSFSVTADVVISIENASSAE